ncbi:MAG TPA: tyrosinase family protein [Gaiellaceae bacterium]
MTARLTRKELVVQGARATAGLAILGSPLFYPATALAAPLTRRDVGGLGATDPIIVGYRKAVQAMKALPASDPRSWSYQAAIHGTLASGSHVAWNTCEHGTYYFWSWHRMYLHFFERIVRKYAGDPTWALPYWNYESAGERTLPAPFRDPASPLYVVSRGAGWNAGTASLPAWAVDTSTGFALTNFTSASSSIEGTPHGNVHVLVGGWMGSVPTAAQDPIFYLHHANIDRLWNLWLALGGGRADPLADATWKTHAFTFFDENANQVTMTGCDVLRAAQQLNYGYEGEPAQVNEFCLRFRPPWIYLLKELYRIPLPPYLVTLRPPVLKVDIANVRARLLEAAKDPNQTLFLKLNDVVAARSPNVVWQVFLGKPGSTDAPSFVGSMALFGMGIRTGTKKFMPAQFSFPIDKAILASANAESLPLTFVPAGPLVNGKPTVAKLASPVRIGSFSIEVEQRRKG